MKVDPARRGRSPAAVRADITDAARRLAREGGYDAVHIRDITQMAGVSIATVYNHFSSRDHILATIQLEWVLGLTHQVDRDQYVRDPADRAVALVRHICRGLKRDPQLGRALVFALGSRDPMVRQVRNAADTLVVSTFTEALGVRSAGIADRLVRLRVTLHGALFSWAHELIDLDDVESALEACVRGDLVSPSLAPLPLVAGVPL